MTQSSTLKVFTRVALPGAALLLFAPLAAAGDSAEAAPLPSRAGDFSLKLETGAAVPLSSPQSSLYDTGAGETLKALWLLNRYLDVGPSATFVELPAASPPGVGTAWSLGGGLGLKRPHDLLDDASFFGISPWIDADVLYVRTGVLDRPGLEVGAGLAVPLGKSRTYWLGPFVRYLDIIQVDHTGFDNRDAKILSIGISLEVGSGVRRPALTIETIRTVNTETIACSDRDGDGVPDIVDRCPDVRGTADNYGCPTYKRIIVTADKLELKEKIQFAWNQATLEDGSFPVLDEVVQALKDNPRFHVEVEGNTSSEGTDEHNMTLSEGRARAVLDYLAAHGIDPARLTSKGFGSTVPIDSNATSAGRENNRRVEFIVHFNILSNGAH